MKSLRHSLVLLFLCSVSVSPLGAQSVSDSVAAILGGRLNHHLSNNQIDSALFFTQELMNHYRVEGNEYEMLRAAVHRAEILRSINSLEESQKLLADYQAVAERLELSTVKSMYYNRLAAVLFEAKEKDLALNALKRSQEIDSIEDYQWRKYSNWNIEGAIYRDRGEFEKAEQVLRQTALYAKENQDSAEYQSALYNLALTLHRSKQYEDCIEACLQYINGYEIPGLEKTRGEVWHLAALCARALEDYPVAYNYLDSAHQQRLTDMERIVDSRVDAFKISNDLEAERLKTSVLEADRSRDQLQILVLAFFLLVTLLIGVVVYLSRERYKSKHQEQTLLNKEMLESLEFKNKLISIVAHDIRNPMASIKGMLQLYNQGLVEKEDLREWMDGLEVSVSNVDLLLENLLNWVKSQSGKIDPYIESVDLNLILNKTLPGLHAQLELKKIELDRPELEAKHLVKADENILAFALRNVLSNALKYSPEGSKVTVRCFDSQTEHILEIQDQGSGIRQEQLEKIRKHQAVSSDGTAAEKGTGMGLSLSIEFLEAMGGRLEIDSTLGEGTRVRIHIPR